MNGTGYALLVLVAVACADSGGPAQDIAGTYRATEARLTRAGKDVDLLAQGAGVSISLQAIGSGHGTTTGSLYLPEAYTDSGGGQTQSLLGTYTYDASAGTVAFDHDSDSFFPYMQWHVRGNRLSAVFTAGEDRLRVTLKRED